MGICIEVPVSGGAGGRLSVAVILSSLFLVPFLVPVFLHSQVPLVKCSRLTW